VELSRAAGGEALADLSHLGLIAVQGEDAAEFLQGQQTNDIRDVSEGRSQLSGLCSPKGRLLATYRVMLRDDVYYLQLPRTMVETVIRRLRLFVLRSKVTLTDASDRFATVGFTGPGVTQLATETLGTLPKGVDECRRVQDLTVVRVPGDPPRFLAIGPSGSVRALWQTLGEAAQPVGLAAWELTDLRAGVPTIQSQTSDAFVPQMVNYQAIGGVSFSKGCYTGQEVVSRTQYLGKLKRRMYPAFVDAPRAPEPGDEVFSPAHPSGQSAGKVVNVIPSPDGGFEVLAVVLIDAADSDQIRLWSEDGPALELRDLPYSLEPETSA
jgi:folate-binding protein YgfZ